MGVIQFHLGEDVAKGLGESFEWLKRYIKRHNIAYTKGSNGRPRFNDEQLAAFYAHLEADNTPPEPVFVRPVAGDPVLTVRGTPPRIPAGKRPKAPAPRPHQAAS